ncbi:MAG: CpaF family protein [Clostridiales bacterium]|nr:CpaF family protein [Clostridiales bacterium]
MNHTSDMKDDEILEIIDQVLMEEGRQFGISVADRSRQRKSLFDSLRRLDVLQELVEDNEITEIMVNGRSHIFLERHGCVEEWEGEFSSQEKLEDVIQQIVSKVNRVVNTASPIVDARLEDGSRVNVVLPPIAPDGPILTIRKFPKEPISMEKLIGWGSITLEAAEFLRILVECGYNLFVSGGTGSGKTTFLNALSRYIPVNERVITIEDSLELQLTEIDNLVRMETRNATMEGASAVTIRDLIRTALRMRPDRIVIGEVRGAEALDLLQAFNTGHDGSMSTAHANSPADMLSRLETMVLMGGDLPLSAIRQQIGSALEILVHLGRLKGGKRKVLSIVEVLGYEKGEIIWQPLFLYEEREGCEKLWPCGNVLQRKRKLELAGARSSMDRLLQLLSVL